MAGIPEEIVERVKAEASIVDVISDYVRLRKTGKNWLGLCPFHDDSKPSMAVEPVRGIFKCFACGKGGNVFTFLMELNGWSFPETVRSLAESLGIEIPDEKRDSEQFSEQERLAAAVRDAARFYYKTLRSEAGTPAQAYFKKRGFTDETIKRFGLGFAPDEWESLLKKLTDQGYTPQELDRAGLVIKRDGRSGWYDRFRGRAIFPIFTATGRIVGFGARRLNEDPNQPKYINSPESPIYQKSRLLYGLYQAKDTIRRTGHALLVEGYVDVISLHQAGVQTAIATCGTAMAQEHAELLARYCSRVILIFDSDKAGQAATERGIDVLLRHGLDVSVLRLPDGEDPDTFIRKFGQKEFERRLEESVSFLEFRVRTLKDAGDLDSPDRSTDAIRSIVATIALIPDALKRELYIQKVAADYHLSEGVILGELERALGKQATPRRHRELLARPSAPPPPDAPPGVEPLDFGEPIEPSEVEESAGEVAHLRKPVSRAEIPSWELGLMSVLVQGDPQMLEHVFARIDPEDFGHPLTRQLVGIVLACYVNQRAFSIEDLVMEELSPELRDLVTLLAVDRESISDYWRKLDPDLQEPNQWRAARDYLIRILRDKLEREFRALQEQAQGLSSTEKMEEEDTILERIKELTRRIEDLRQLHQA